jgi:F-type H+-transporting ATPase subunit epsilon
MNETVSIISFTSEAAQEVDLERAKSAKAKAQSRLSGQSSLSEVELIKFRRKLERAEMRIRLANLK